MPLTSASSPAMARSSALVLTTICLLVIPNVVFALGTNDGSSSSNACEGNCTGTGTSRTCTFTAKLNIFASATGYYVFEECGATVQPTLAMERGVEYVFVQDDPTNWMHPLGFAYLADGAHKEVDELEPGIPATPTSGCAADNTCQAPMYYHGATFLGTVAEDGSSEPVVYPAPNNSGNFGLDHFEPAFQMARGDWLDSRFREGPEGYNIRLTLTDSGQNADVFYFCHVHEWMTGRIKIIDGPAGSLAQVADEPALGYVYATPEGFDSECGTYGVAPYAGNNVCHEGAFVCGNSSNEVQRLFGACLHAMDCAMHEQMRVDLADDPLTTFMHQMIPHHENAVNMAKAILKMDVLSTANDPDGELEHLFWTIVNEQNYQIMQMQDFLRAGGQPTHYDVHCEFDHHSVHACPHGCVPEPHDRPSMVYPDPNHHSDGLTSRQRRRRLLFGSFARHACPAGCVPA